MEYESTLRLTLACVGLQHRDPAVVQKFLTCDKHVESSMQLYGIALEVEESNGHTNRPAVKVLFENEHLGYIKEADVSNAIEFLGEVGEMTQVRHKTVWLRRMGKDESGAYSWFEFTVSVTGVYAD